jgi:enamine deaminase RidA (YjgF/YER057c/UK114 family)
VKLVHYVSPEVTPASKEYKSISEIRKQYIPKDFPVSTLVQVVGFMVEGMLIEADAIAVLD